MAVCHKVHRHLQVNTFRTWDMWSIKIYKWAKLSGTKLVVFFSVSKPYFSMHMHTIFVLFLWLYAWFWNVYWKIVETIETINAIMISSCDWFLYDISTSFFNEFCDFYLIYIFLNLCLILKIFYGKLLDDWNYLVRFYKWKW